MRAAQAAAMPDACTISRFSQVTDGQGGWTDTYATASTTVCRVAAGGLSPQEAAMANKLTSKTVWVVSLPALTSVLLADRIIVGARTFEVLGLLAPHTWESARRAIAEEIL